MVVAQYVITAVPDPEATLDEFARVMRPGGEIILVNHIGAADLLVLLPAPWLSCIMLGAKARRRKVTPGSLRRRKKPRRSRRRLDGTTAASVS